MVSVFQDRTNWSLPLVLMAFTGRIPTWRSVSKGNVLLHQFTELSSTTGADRMSIPLWERNNFYQKSTLCHIYSNLINIKLHKVSASLSLLKKKVMNAYQKLFLQSLVMNSNPLISKPVCGPLPRPVPPKWMHFHMHSVFLPQSQVHHLKRLGVVIKTVVFN